MLFETRRLAIQIYPSVQIIYQLKAMFKGKKLRVLDFLVI